MDNQKRIVFLVLVSFLVIINQGLLLSALSSFSGYKSGFSFSLAKSSVGEGKIVGPKLNDDGKTVSLVEYSTITSNEKVSKTGDPKQDAISLIVPKGVPFYVAEGEGVALVQSVSFDNPIGSLNVWSNIGRGRTKIDLTSDQEARFNKIVGSFTCDYCCGSPNYVTKIAQCGCSHAAAWKGVAKYLIKYYGDKYTDEQITGELTRWKGAWYPKGMVDNYLVYTGQLPAEAVKRQGGAVGILKQFSA
ncbi:hypothetical protein HY498_02080 [Candidatus Woesearchaeota archaeon]|nr:hypothetical protein [Candidatus Woesearchaeota archaeon]